LPSACSTRTSSRPRRRGSLLAGERQDELVGEVRVHGAAGFQKGEQLVHSLVGHALGGLSSFPQSEEAGLGSLELGEQEKHRPPENPTACQPPRRRALAIGEQAGARAASPATPSRAARRRNSEDDHVEHDVRDPIQVWIELAEHGAEEALEIKSTDGTNTILEFRTSALPETVDGILHP
jgi:hypothetical protein